MQMVIIICIKICINNHSNSKKKEEKKDKRYNPQNIQEDKSNYPILLNHTIVFLNIKIFISTY